jgi:hypothetical protein
MSLKLHYLDITMKLEVHEGHRMTDGGGNDVITVLSGLSKVPEFLDTCLFQCNI